MLASCWPSKGQFVPPPQNFTPPRKTDFYGRSAGLSCRSCGAACAGRKSCWLKLLSCIGWLAGSNAAVAWLQCGGRLVAVRWLPEVAWSQSVVAWELVQWRAVDFAEWRWSLNRLDGHWMIARLELRLLYQSMWAELRLVVVAVSADWPTHVRSWILSAV
jgi:hypothetical protein